MYEVRCLVRSFPASLGALAPQFARKFTPLGPSHTEWRSFGERHFAESPHLLVAGAEIRKGVQFTTHLTEVEVARIQLAARQFIRDEEGAALAEYGILVAFIAIVAITAVTFFGSKISAKFSTIANSFS